MKDEVLEGLRRLKPPPGDAGPDEIQAWRWFIAILLGATSMGLALHVAMVCGFLTILHPGFVRADEFQTMQKERRLERETDLETKILDTRLKQCTTAGDLRALHGASLQKMRVEYARLTGRDYPLPACEDFGKQT